MKWILILLSTLAFKSCGTYNASTLIEKDAIILTELNDTYYIKTLNNIDVSAYKLDIKFDSKTKQITGFSGCNRFFGNYELTGDSLKFSAFGLTRMLCGEQKSEIENEFHETTSKVNKVTIETNSITLLNNNKVLIIATKADVNNSIVFDYSTSARGSYKSIKIDSSGVFIKEKRSANPVSKKIKKANWNTLLSIVETINLKSLSSLEPPSKKHQFDGAALAHFKITKGDNIYELAPFDHGNSNPVIKSLVKEILSIAENIE